MIVPLLAGCAETVVVSMLSERVVLRVLLMLAEWASAKPSTFLVAAGLGGELRPHTSLHSNTSRTSKCTPDPGAGAGGVHVGQTDG